MAEKNYVTSSIKKVTTQYGELMNCNFKLEDLQKLESNGWVSITIAERKEPSEKGATHYAFENTYKPEPKQESKKTVVEDDGLPF